MTAGRSFWRLALVLALMVVVPGQSQAGRGMGCDSSCPIAPDGEAAEMLQQLMTSGPSYSITVEARAQDGKLLHRASGTLDWGRRHHIGGTDLRDLGFDRPDYEVNSSLIAPRKIWTSI